MSETTTPPVGGEGTGATATAAAPLPLAPASPPVAAAVATPPAAPLPPPPPAPPQDPTWLPARLEQARRAVLTELGATDVKDVKAALDAYKAHLEANKTELQRATERAALVDPLTKERDAYRGAVEAGVKRTLELLTAEQRAAVEALSGGDPLRTTATIELLRPTWAAQAAPPPPPLAPPLPPPPATTAPTAAPPAPGAAKTKFDEWQDLEKAGKHNAASMFYTAHQLAIEQHRPKE